MSLYTFLYKKSKQMNETGEAGKLLHPWEKMGEIDSKS